MKRRQEAGTNQGAANEIGLTIVELMVSLLLAAILSAGMFYMTAGQTATYKTQLASVSMQEDLWSAMEYVQRQLRGAGFGFALNCPNGRVMRWDGVAGASCTPTPSRIVGFQAFNNCNVRETPIANCPDGSGVDSFVVTSATGVGDGTRLASNAISASDGSLRISAAGGIEANDLIVLSRMDGAATSYCTVVRATAAPTFVSDGEFSLPIFTDGDYNPGAGSGCVLFPPLATGYTRTATQLARFPAGPVQLAPRYFAIDRSRNAPRLVTWSTLDEPSSDLANLETVAQGVEDIQIAFACDDNTDGVFAEGENEAARQNDEWAFNVAGETALPACNPARIGLIRITLTARTDGPDPDLRTGFRPAAEDRPAGTPEADQLESGGVGTYPRRSLTAVVRPRNL